MAKKTKDSNLSLEERLEQALIPNWAEPYKLPPNWCWINLKSVLRHQSGNSKLIKGRLASEKKDGLYDAYSASGQDVYTESYEHEGDAIIVSAVGARCGKAFLASGKWSAIANTHIIYSNDRLLDIRYLHYVLNDESWWVKSGSAQPFVVVNESLLRPFALPPLQEQQRIVSRIESMFTKLDEAKEKAQEVVDGFETRKAAILHKAFSGELTAKWREENHIDQNWSLTSLEKIAERIFDGPFGSNLKSEDYVSSGIRVVRLENLKNLWFDDSKQSFVSREKYDTIAKHTVYPSDLIMSTFISDETKVCQMPKHIPYAINKADCIAIRLKSDVNKRFVLYYLSSKFVFDTLQNQIHGATRPRVNSKQIKSIAIKMPSVSEQNEIVRILDRMYDSELKAIETAEAVIEQIDTMKKAILVRAFRGELGTNDPSEESAVELLKKVLSGGEN